MYNCENEQDQHWFGLWHVSYPLPKHYKNQYSLILIRVLERNFENCFPIRIFLLKKVKFILQHKKKFWNQKYTPRGWFNIKMTSCQYRKSHCGDKTILRPSYLHNGIGKMTSLYWIRAQGGGGGTLFSFPEETDLIMIRPDYVFCHVITILLQEWRGESVIDYTYYSIITQTHL